jgi:hypothetical protein
MQGKREGKEDSSGDLQRLGISNEDIIDIIEERIQDIVNFIENLIYNAENSQKESEYKKWYPYELGSDDKNPILDEIISSLILHDGNDNITKTQYTEILYLVGTVLAECMRELKDTYTVRVRIEDTNYTYSRVVLYKRELEGFNLKWTPFGNFGLGEWLIPVEEDDSEKQQWLQESMTDTIGKGVIVKLAMAGVDDDDDVREITEWLNSEEGRFVLDNMEAWQNGDRLKRTSSRGKDVYIYKNKSVAMVYDK